jgi:hypothetical protein
MALTRKFLREKGIEDETVIQEIIDAHMESVTPLKAYRDEAERLTGELSTAQEQLKEANKKLESAGKDDYKAKYDALVQENQQKEVRTAKETVIRDLCKDVGLSEKGTALALKYTNLDTIELGSDGKPTNGAEVKEALLSDWGDYKETRNQTGADVKNPPNGGGGNPSGMTKEQILAIKDGAARRQAMAENPTLFGLPANNS